MSTQQKALIDADVILSELYLEKLRYDSLYNLFIIGQTNVGKKTFIKQLFPDIQFHQIFDTVTFGKTCIIHENKSIVLHVWLFTVASFDSNVRQNVNTFINDVASHPLKTFKINKIIKIIMADVTQKNSHKFIEKNHIWLNCYYIFNKNDLNNMLSDDNNWESIWTLYSQKYYSISSLNEFDTQYIYDSVIRHELFDSNKQKYMADITPNKKLHCFVLTGTVPVCIIVYTLSMTLYRVIPSEITILASIIWPLFLWLIGMIKLKHQDIMLTIHGYMIYLIILFIFYEWFLLFQYGMHIEIPTWLIVIIHTTLIVMAFIFGINSQSKRSKDLFKFIGMTLDFGYNINDIIYVSQYINSRQKYTYSSTKIIPQKQQYYKRYNKTIIIYGVILLYQTCVMLYLIITYFIKGANHENICWLLGIISGIHTIGVIWCLITMYAAHKMCIYMKYVPLDVDLTNVFALEQKLIISLKKHEICKSAYNELSKIGTFCPELVFDYL